MITKLKAKWITISKTGEDLEIHLHRISGKGWAGNRRERGRVDSFEEFIVTSELDKLSEKEAREKGFLELKKYIDERLSEGYNKEALLTPSGENFVKWIILDKTNYKAENLEDYRKEYCIKKENGFYTTIPFKARHLHDFKWMENSFDFDYPKESKPPKKIIQLRKDTSEFSKKIKENILEEQLSWYEKNGEKYIYVLELYNLKTSDYWFYVGQSKALKNRIRKHIKDPPSPHAISNESFFVTELQDVEGGYKNKKKAYRREREKAFEIAIEKETKNILGGK